MERKPAVAITLLVTSLFIAPSLFSQVLNSANNGWLKIVDDKVIFDNRDHAAFTSLEDWNGDLIVAFREGEAHDASASNKGVIRILQHSEQGWIPQHTFIKEGIDLRDPCLLKLNNRLLLYSHMFYSELKDKEWTDLKPISHNAPYAPKLPSIWKKRIYKDVAYGIGFRSGEWPLLFKSTDGINWEVVCEYKLGGNATETDLLFIGETMYICMRVDTPSGSNSYWGVSKFPFTKCEWSVMDISIGSPELIAHSKKTILLACREYDYHRKDGTDKRFFTLFALDKKGHVKERYVLTDDAGQEGDQAYPSIRRGNNDEYHMSYYSGNRTKTKVSMLTFKVNECKIRKSK